MGMAGPPELPIESTGDLLMSGDHLNTYAPNTSDESDMDETATYDGYEPLPTSEIAEDLASLEIENNTTNEESNLPEVISADAEIEATVWREPRPRELTIELDNNRTQEIMQAMANITLPNTVIPTWAQGVPEERWKQDLLERIRETNNST